MTRAEILDTAKNIITTDRNAQYGAPEDNFCVIADYWSTYLSRHNGGHMVFITPTDVAVMMTLFKIGRITTAGEFTADSFVDLCGYAACAGELAAGLPQE